MKKKILKIMGVALTFMLVFSLGMVFTASPAAAADDYWSAFSIPEADSDGDWFMDDDISTVGPIARDIDGYFWAYVEQTADTDEIYHSLDTEGRSWELTYYSDATYGVGGADVLDIVCSPLDADVVYVCDIAAVYKTEDGGDTFEEVGNFDGDIGKTITSLAVGWDADDDPRVYIGLADSAPGADTDGTTEGIYYLYDTAWGQTWTDLQLDATDAARDDSTVWGINVSPNFADDAFVTALITNYEDDNTQLVWNVGATVGSWAYCTLDDIEDDDGEATDGSAPQFPADFDGDDFLDEDGEIFVAAAGDFSTTGVHAAGGVWRIYGVDDGDEEQCDASISASADDLDADLCSLAVVGDEGATQLLAGEDGDNDVWYSYDDGENWEQAEAEGMSPVGAAADTFVLMDADFDEDAGIGWAATDGDECGLHITVDGGISWQGISLLDTEINHIVAAEAIGTAPDTVYLLTDDAAAGAKEMFRYSADSAAWERIYEEGLMTVALGDMDIIGVYEDTVVLADSGTTDMIFSEDGGQIFEDTDREPGSTIISLLLIDEEIWWVGDTDGDLCITDTAGSKAWDAEIEIDDAGDDITSLAVRGDEALAGNADSEVFYSEDEGETWDLVGNTTFDLEANSTADAATYVCFDSGNDNLDVIYATTDDVVGRYQYLTTDLSEDWELFVDAAALVTTTGPIGIACSEGVVYVGSNSDADANNVAGGVLRIVEPIYDLDDITLSTVDTVVDAELSVGDGFQGGMLVTSSNGLNVLWGIDQDAGATATQLWYYNDLLIGPPIGGLATVDDVSAILEWDGFDNVADYEVAIYSSEAMLSAATRWYDDDIDDDEPVFGISDATTQAPHADTALDSGTQYWWCVRVQNSDYNTGTVTSKYSAAWTFTTEPGTMTIDADQFGPAIGATNVSTTPSFGWNLIEEADKYAFELADNPDFLSPIATTTTTNPVYDLDATLSYGTNYFWRVKAVSGITESNWATGTFTTEAAPVVAPVPPPPAAAPELVLPAAAAQIAPQWIYAVIAIGATLAVVVIVLIVRTRKQ